MSRSCLRVTSPEGASSFTTSAPSQARICVQEGPDWTCVMSRTRTPSSALPKTVPLLVDVWLATPEPAQPAQLGAACASKSDHTLISDRLPDPAQLGAIEVVCEGSHSSRQKVTDITRRTVYLIQSGRKPPVSCRSPAAASTACRTRVTSRRCMTTGAVMTPAKSAQCSRGRRQHQSCNPLYFNDLTTRQD